MYDFKERERKAFFRGIENVNGCLIWNGFKNENGYGMTSYKGKKQLAHRVSWQMHFGDIPENMCICHKCDNPSCVNPDHLFMGTRKDNSMDMVRKGRNIRSRANNSLLNKEDVLEIRRMAKNGINKHEIAMKYKISLDNAYNVMTGRSWKTVPME